MLILSVCGYGNLKGELRQVHQICCMKDFAKTDSLLFDMDGTLWDGVETYAQGFNDYFVKNNIQRQLTRAGIAGFMGWEESKFLEATLPELLYEERKTAYHQIIQHQYDRIATHGGQLYDSVAEGLKSLATKYKLFIVSNCPEFTIDHFMKWAGISHLITDTMAHGKNYKPKHENIRLLINKHNLQNPVYIGDTDSDSKQSRLVPLPFVFVSYGFGKTDDYDLRFDSFGALVDCFLKIDCLGNV